MTDDKLDMAIDYVVDNRKMAVFRWMSVKVDRAVVLPIAVAVFEKLEADEFLQEMAEGESTRSGAVDLLASYVQEKTDVKRTINSIWLAIILKIIITLLIEWWLKHGREKGPGL